jgi:adenylosuccinate lyase
MPHKINPIDFENAEGNLGLANALYEHFANKLPISRWQRDLSDSTVLRNLGISLGYSLLAYQSLQKGIKKAEPNTAKLEQDLNNHWEILAEPIQTIMRRHGHPTPYEQLKALTRGEQLDEARYKQLIDKLGLPDALAAELKSLKPSSYIGLAHDLAIKI